MRPVYDLFSLSTSTHCNHLLLVFSSDGRCWIMMLEFHKLALMVGFACWAVTNAAGIQEGKCRYVRPVQINLQLLEGPWYAVRRAIAEPFKEQNSDCEFQKLYFAKNQYGQYMFTISSKNCNMRQN